MIYDSQSAGQGLFSNILTVVDHFNTDWEQPTIITWLLHHVTGIQELTEQIQRLSAQNKYIELPEQEADICWPLTVSLYTMSDMKHRFRSRPAHNWTPTIPKMKKTKKHNSNTLPSIVTDINGEEENPELEREREREKERKKKRRISSSWHPMSGRVIELRQDISDLDPLAASNRVDPLLAARQKGMHQKMV